MSLQSIINSSTNIRIERPSMVSQQMTRSGRLISNAVPTHRPWRFSVSYRPAQRYSDARGMIEDIDLLDRVYTEDIDIGYSNPKLDYITKYQGTMPLTSQACVMVSSNDYGSSITIQTPSNYNGESGLLFAKGDFIQPGKVTGYPYVYTVVADVTPPAPGQQVDLFIHRGFIPDNYPAVDSFILSADPSAPKPFIATGTACRFRVQVISKPSTQVQVDKFLGLEGEFVLQEVISG